MTRGYSAVVLAGGDGTRLRSLTRQLAGDDRPKQFCHLLSAETLLAATRRRARRLIAPGSLFTVVTRKHERFYRPELADAAPGTKQVLQARPADLAVLPVSGVEWTDLGDPARVLATRERARWQLASA